MNWRSPAYQIQRIKKSNLIIPALVGIITILLCLVIGVSSISLYRQKKEYEKQIDWYQTQLDSEIKREAEIHDYALYTKTTAFYEEVAREKYRLVHDNEILFVNE